MWHIRHNYAVVHYVWKENTLQGLFINFQLIVGISFNGSCVVWATNSVIKQMITSHNTKNVDNFVSEQDFFPPFLFFQPK